jgi:hypothetical protein
MKTIIAFFLGFLSIFGQTAGAPKAVQHTYTSSSAVQAGLNSATHDDSQAETRTIVTSPSKLPNSQIIMSTSPSTNSPSWKLIIQQDGSALFQAVDLAKFEQARVSPPFGDYDARSYPAGTFSRIVSLVDAIGDVSKIPKELCAYSASYGTATVIIYDGSISPDMGCIKDTATQTEKDLKIEIARVSNNLLSNEPMSTIFPTIMALSPTSGPLGTQFTIKGRGFTLSDNEIDLFQKAGDAYTIENFIEAASTNEGTTLVFTLPFPVTRYTAPTTPPGIYYISVHNINGETSMLPLTVTADN